MILFFWILVFIFIYMYSRDLFVTVKLIILLMETSPRYKEKFAFAMNIFFKIRMHNIQQYETGRAYNFNKMQFYNCFRVLWRDVKCKLLKGITTIHVYLTYTSSHLWNIFKKILIAGIIWLAVFLFLWHVENILNHFFYYIY